MSTEIESDDKQNSLRSLIAFVVPLCVYLGLGFLEPDSVDVDVSTKTRLETSQPSAADSAKAADHLATPLPSSDQNLESNNLSSRSLLPIFFSIRVLATVLVLLPFIPVYRQLLWSISWEAFAVGITGVVAWIAICQLGIEQRIANSIGLGDWLNSSARSQVNPFTQFAGQKSLMIWFIAVRFMALAVVVPLVEELFLRGFLVRFFTQDAWWELTLKELPHKAYGVAAAYAVLTHPQEFLAAIIWFSMVTWLMKRRGSLFDCVVAHAVTNALLGIYVVTFQQWQLW